MREPKSWMPFDRGICHSDLRYYEGLGERDPIWGDSSAVEVALRQNPGTRSPDGGGWGILPSGDSGHFGLLSACLYEGLFLEPAKATSGGEKKGIAKMFENVASEEMDYEEFLEAIDAYRRKILSGAEEETLSAGENR